MYKHALIAMKAYPFHAGHELLINEAIKQAQRVTVFVVWSAGQNPRGPERAEWVQKTYPNVDVRLVADIGTDDTTIESSRQWAVYTQDMLGHDMPDVVFSSEEYGRRWAQFMDALGYPCEHVMIDQHRTRVPISGTAIRNDPYANWSYLNKYARLSYLKRVLIVGAESTGKTTLCQNLARKYGTLYVPEYGRIYSEKVGPNKNAITADQERVIFAKIVNEQPRLDREIEQDARMVCFYDTDLYLTSLWYERWQPNSVGDPLHQTILEAAAINDRYDLVLVSMPDTPFVDDGYREFNKQEEREEFTKRLFNIYAYAYTRGKKPVTVRKLTGTWQERENKAIASVNDLLRINTTKATLPQEVT